MDQETLTMAAIGRTIVDLAAQKEQLLQALKAKERDLEALRNELRQAKAAAADTPTTC